MKYNSSYTVDQQYILEVKDLHKWYPVGQGLFNQLAGKEIINLKAVDGVNLNIYRGEILGLVGQSGSGKSTFGEIILRLQDPTSGNVLFNGIDIGAIRGSNLKEFRRRVQIIFQDPYATLNPRFPIFRTVVEPLLVNGVRDRNECKQRVRTALIRAGLEADDGFLKALPHQLSGGQRQRVAIARAIVFEPELLIADEPVSMLDVSIRAGILQLLDDLRKNLGLSILFISHDLSTIQSLCDRVAIMYLGIIVEIGTTHEIIERAKHPYSHALIRSVPNVDPDIKRERQGVGFELIPSSINLPAGCRFAPTCGFTTSKCTEEEPELVEIEHNHWVRCFHPCVNSVFEQNSRN
jgi:peptide/nickel transport system ATP-binding protein